MSVCVREALAARHRAATFGVRRDSSDCPTKVKIHIKAEGGFSLLELLVAIAVIAVLAALLLPAITAAKSKAKRTVCLNNLRQINVGVRLYADDSSDATPRTPSTRPSSS